MSSTSANTQNNTQINESSFKNGTQAITEQRENTTPKQESSDAVMSINSSKQVIPNESKHPDEANSNHKESDEQINPDNLYELNNSVDSNPNYNENPYTMLTPLALNSDLNTTSFSVNEIKIAATDVRTYIETYHKLPDYVNISGINVDMPQFLELLTTALLQINSSDDNLLILKTFSALTNPKESIHAGNILKSEFLKIANDIKNYMDSTGKTPDYAYGTSLGTYLGFQNLVYMYSMILDYYNTSGKIADWATMEPWSVITSRPVIDPNTPRFTVDQIKIAASNVRAFIESNYRLPDYVQIGSTQVSMPQFLELLTTSLLQINTGNNNPVPLREFSAPTNQKDNIRAGNIPQAEFLKIAGDIKNYMGSTGKTPDYAYGTSLGTYLGFENLIYMYSMILDYYNTSGKIADWATMEPWSIITSKAAIDPNATKFSVDQIKDAATRVRAFIETYSNLPNYVQIGDQQVKIPQFLELLTTALLQINSGNNNSISLRTFSIPTNPKDNINAGDIYKTEYLKIANDIKNYMDSTGKTPDYAYETSLGTYLGYQNLVYMYSMILDYYNTSGKMANFAIMKSWNVLGVTDYGRVTIDGPYGNINAPKIAIIIGVHPLESNAHNAIVELIKRKAESLNYCYYIYTIEVTKDATDYDKSRMNGQLLANQFAVPHIINHNYQLALDIHANQGNYAETWFIFAPLEDNRSKTIALQIKNNVPGLVYYNPPSQTSPQYVTIPLINAGIPAIVYETYLYEPYEDTLIRAEAFLNAVDNNGLI